MFIVHCKLYIVLRQKDFVFNLCLLIFLNLLVKPFWMLGVDVGVQNSVGAADYGIYFSILNFTLLFNMVLDMGTTNFNNRNIARNNQLLDKHLSSYIILRLLLGLAYFAVIFAVALLIGYRGIQLRLLFWIGLNGALHRVAEGEFAPFDVELAVFRGHHQEKSALCARHLPDGVLLPHRLGDAGTDVAGR